MDHAKGWPLAQNDFFNIRAFGQDAFVLSTPSPT